MTIFVRFMSTVAIVGAIFNSTAQAGDVLFSRTTYGFPQSYRGIIEGFRINPPSNNLGTPFKGYLFSNAEIPRKQTILIIVPRAVKLPVNFKISEELLLDLNRHYSFTEDEIKQNIKIPTLSGQDVMAEVLPSLSRAKFLRLDSKYQPPAVDGPETMWDTPKYSIFAGAKIIGTIYEKFSAYGNAFHSNFDRRADVVTDPAFANELEAEVSGN
jgi:hypothetical protein